MPENLYATHQRNMDLGRLLRRQQEMFREMGKLQRSPDEYESTVVDSTRLDKYRAKSACMVHKASGDPEAVCKEGLAVFDALTPARERANKTWNT